MMLCDPHRLCACCLTLQIGRARFLDTRAIQTKAYNDPKEPIHNTSNPNSTRATSETLQVQVLRTSVNNSIRYSRSRTEINPQRTLCSRGKHFGARQSRPLTTLLALFT